MLPFGEQRRTSTPGAAARQQAESARLAVAIVGKQIGSRASYARANGWWAQEDVSQT